MLYALIPLQNSQNFSFQNFTNSFHSIAYKVYRWPLLIKNSIPMGIKKLNKKNLIPKKRLRFEIN